MEFRFLRRQVFFYISFNNLFPQYGGVDANLAAILVATIRVVGGVLAIFFIKKLPRLHLVMSTMTLMAVSMAVLGGVVYLEELGADSGALRCFA